MTLDGFFLDWAARAEGDRRSLRRAAQLIRELGLEDGVPPVLAVVGSKGKGTTATYASAHLAAAGVDTVTVTSPGLRNRRDRIRRQGRSIPQAELVDLARTLQSAREVLPAPHDGYLSPSGLFIIAGVLYARKHNVNALVLEAGMGGRSDEVSLFAPTAVAMSAIFAEHIGVLGETVSEIARDKAAVAGEVTEAFVRLPLPSELASIVDHVVKDRTQGQAAIETVRPFSSGLPLSVFPQGLPRFSAELGSVAAERLLNVTGRARPTPERLKTVLSSIRLPGRLSHHTVPGSQTRLIVDAAIHRTGISAAITYASQHWPKVDHVLVCLPDHKDVAGAITEFGDLPVTMMTLPSQRLTFTTQVPQGWDRESSDALTPEFLAGLGEHVLVLGTGYFTSRVLDAIDADTERLFHA